MRREMRRVVVVLVGLWLLGPATVRAQGRPWHRPATERAGAEGPVEAVKAAFQALQKRDVHAIIMALPASWRGDLEGVVRDYVLAMDPEVFNRTMGVFQHLVTALSSHRETVLDSLADHKVLSREDVLTLIRNLERLRENLKKSGLTTQDGFRSFSLETFARENGSVLLDLVLAAAGKESRASIDAAFGMLVARSVEFEGSEPSEKWGSVSKVKVNAAGQTLDMRLVQVEGKWVSEEMAEQWSSTVATLRSGLEEWKKELKDGREEHLRKLSRLDAAVAQFEKTGRFEPVREALEGESEAPPTPAPEPDAWPGPEDNGARLPEKR